MSPKEVVLTGIQVKKMVASVAKPMERKIKDSPLFLAPSDSYGFNLHRTWIFTIETDFVVGSIERYYTGLKMICSVLKGAPRTYFFTVEGEKATNNALKQKEVKE